MPEKRSKYDTDPLDPDFARRAEENLWGSRRAEESAGRADETDPLPPASVTEEQTRRFDEQLTDTYPSVFAPPAYKPPQAPEAQPFGAQPFTSFGAGFGAGSHQPPATSAPPPPGPSSQYQPPYGRPGDAPSSRPVTRLGLPENVANVLPYVPFYIGLVASIVELAVVPRNETRTRFHAAQGLALQLAITVGLFIFQFLRLATGSGFGRTVFWVASFIFLIYSAVRVWHGKPHHIAPLEEPARWLDEKIPPIK